jgi:hypothetical protein
MALEYVLADVAGRFVADAVHRLARQQVATELVRDRQRVAVRMVPEPELALVVNAPGVVRPMDGAKVRRDRLVPRPMTTPRGNEAGALKDVADRARGGELTPEASLQRHFQLLRPPRGMPLAFREDHLRELGRRLVRHVVRSS